MGAIRNTKALLAGSFVVLLVIACVLWWKAGRESEAADADQREVTLREIWARNASFDRARVHRAGLILVVAWTSGVSPECRKAVNAKVTERLASPPSDE